MTHLILASEMEELTGAKTPSKQCDILRKNGVRFTLRADGRPALSWEAYNRQLSATAANDITVSGPNLSAI